MSFMTHKQLDQHFKDACGPKAIDAEAKRTGLSKEAVMIKLSGGFALWFIAGVDFMATESTKQKYKDALKELDNYFEGGGD